MGCGFWVLSSGFWGAGLGWFSFSPYLFIYGLGEVMGRLWGMGPNST